MENHEVRTYTITRFDCVRPAGLKENYKKQRHYGRNGDYHQHENYSRSSGYSAVASAAYRSGSLMLDERTGLTHDYTRKAVWLS